MCGERKQDGTRENDVIFISGNLRIIFCSRNTDQKIRGRLEIDQWQDRGGDKTRFKKIQTKHKAVFTELGS